MRIRILAAAARQPKWVEQGVAEYAARLPKQFKLKFHDVPLGNRANKAAGRAAVADEGKRMLAAVRETDVVVALDVGGRKLSTEDFARRLDGWLHGGRDLVFLIGGPDGLDPACLARADAVLSLSALTYPHGLVRILLTEQLYRAWTVLTNHPYHRA